MTVATVPVNAGSAAVTGVVTGATVGVDAGAAAVVDVVLAGSVVVLPGEDVVDAVDDARGTAFSGPDDPHAAVTRSIAAAHAPTTR